MWLKDNGGAVADGSPQSINGQAGAMNNYPLRGGKGGYFEGGVRSAAFLHAPALLPAQSAGSVERGLVSVADWWATFAEIAGLDSTDPGALRNRTGVPAPWGCAENAVCEFGLDSISMWSYLSRRNHSLATEAPPYTADTAAAAAVAPIAASPRAELPLGVLGGGALLQVHGDKLYKYIEGAQYPDVSTSSAATSAATISVTSATTDFLAPFVF